LRAKRIVAAAEFYAARRTDIGSTKKLAASQVCSTPKLHSTMPQLQNPRHQLEKREQGKSQITTLPAGEANKDTKAHKESWQITIL
jgi:hypothetical protein